MKYSLIALALLISTPVYAGEWNYSGTPQIIESGQSNQGVAITNEEHEQRLNEHQVHVGPDPGPYVPETKLPLMTTTRTIEYKIIDNNARLEKRLRRLEGDQELTGAIARKNFIDNKRHQHQRLFNN